MKWLVLASIVLLAAGCGSDLEPISPNGSPPSTIVDPGVAHFRIAVSAPAEGEGIILDGADFVFDSNRGELSFRAALMNGTDRPLFAPLQIILATIQPEEITTVDADGLTPRGLPFYDFSEEVGANGVLEPGESSERKTMTFSDPERQAFALGAVLATAIGPADGAIGGVVFFDLNGDGRRDRGEMGIARIPIVLLSGSQVLAETGTDGDGRYLFRGLEPGLYSVRKEGREPPTTSPNPLHVALVAGEGGEAQSYLDANFACIPVRPRPEPGPFFGPLRVLANGDSLRAYFELDRLPRMPVLMVEVVTANPSQSVSGMIALNGRALVTPRDFEENPTGLRREIPAELLRVGRNAVDVVAATRDRGDAFLVVTMIEAIR